MNRYPLNSWALNSVSLANVVLATAVMVGSADLTAAGCRCQRAQAPLTGGAVLAAAPNRVQASGPALFAAAAQLEAEAWQRHAGAAPCTGGSAVTVVGVRWKVGAAPLTASAELTATPSAALGEIEIAGGAALTVNATSRQFARSALTASGTLADTVAVRAQYGTAPLIGGTATISTQGSLQVCPPEEACYWAHEGYVDLPGTAELTAGAVRRLQASIALVSGGACAAEAARTQFARCAPYGNAVVLITSDRLYTFAQANLLTGSADLTANGVVFKRSDTHLAAAATVTVANAKVHQRHAGRVTCTGTAMLTVVQQKIHPANADMTAASLVTSGATRALMPEVAMTGTAELDVPFVSVMYEGQAALVAAAETTADATWEQTADVALVAEAEVTAEAERVLLDTVAMDGAAEVTADAEQTLSDTVAMDGAVAITALGLREVFGEVALTGVADIATNADGYSFLYGAGLLTGEAQLDIDATHYRAVPGAASLIGTAQLTAWGYVPDLTLDPATCVFYRTPTETAFRREATETEFVRSSCG